MRSTKLWVVLGTLMLLGGCWSPPSLRPLLTEKELIFEPALVGTWSAVIEGEETTLTFEQSGDKAYLLSFEREGKSAKYEAALGRLGDFLFLNVFPEDDTVLENHAYPALIPAHAFYRIRIKGDVLHIAFLSPEWLAERIEEGKLDMGYQCLDEANTCSEGEILLTASTPELQAFVLKYAEEAEAFPEMDEFHRQK